MAQTLYNIPMTHLHILLCWNSVEMQLVCGWWWDVCCVCQRGWMVDQRTCRSYSLPCFSFSRLIHRVDGDVVGGERSQPLQPRGGPRDLQGHFPPSAAWDVSQAVVADSARRCRPRHFHAAAGLIWHCQSLESRRGWGPRKEELSVNFVLENRLQEQRTNNLLRVTECYNCDHCHNSFRKKGDLPPSHLGLRKSTACSTSDGKS